MSERTDQSSGAPAPAEAKAQAPARLPDPQAQRALEEAQARREAAQGIGIAKEVNGPKGPEPTRYGDWERKGIISDF